MHRMIGIGIVTLSLLASGIFSAPPHQHLTLNDSAHVASQRDNRSHLLGDNSGCVPPYGFCSAWNMLCCDDINGNEFECNCGFIIGGICNIAIPGHHDLPGF